MRTTPLRPEGLLFAALLLGCDTARDTPTQSRTMVPSVREFVTGEAADHLDANGRFVLEPPRPPADITIISPDRARELALAYLRTWGPSAAEIWSAQAKRRIEPGSLTLSQRVYYADTPHGRIPDGYHGAYQRMIGPWYLLQFTAAGEPVLGLAISAYSTDLEIRDGMIREPLEGGEHFNFHVIMPHQNGATGFPDSPEQAVEYVHAITGARVVRVPALVLRNSAWSQFTAQWRLVLDRPVMVELASVEGTSQGRTRLRVQQLFVGPASSILIASREQGNAARLPVVPRGAGKHGIVTVPVPLREGMFVQYEEVRLVPEN